MKRNTSDGIITGSIDDIEFYNNKRWVIKNFDEEELEEMKTFEERLQELFDKQNKVNVDAEQKRLEQLKREKIPDWIKFPTGLWVDSFLSDDEFYRIIEYLIKMTFLQFRYLIIHHLMILSNHKQSKYLKILNVLPV